jgi:hypothetical protein
MVSTTQIKIAINKVLEHANLHLDTLTEKRAEHKRLLELEQTGYFERSVFPIPDSFQSLDLERIIRELSLEELNLDHLAEPFGNAVGYTYDNDYFSSPDAEILYAIVQKFRPEKVVEVGCGNSTRIIRQAILDGGLTTKLTSIDPQPRVEINELSDEIRRNRVESLQDFELFRSLGKGDILFIDSSHEVRTGNDVVFLYLNVIPILRPGVLVHIHDIFLPFDYPRKWILEERWPWNEQYLVHSFLTLGNMFEVVWAGHYLQRTNNEFAKYFPSLDNRSAKSLWLRKLA